ncbi:MAG: hypothetical protein CL608_07845 [Anaerolineaceae bacterium]|nr:hypothetical protein [Anaerolineaceae bacterium]
MAGYLRVTRECTLNSMQPALATAVRDYMAQHDLGDVETAALFCGETTSTRQKKRLFGKKVEETSTGILLTPKWLIWVTEQENETPTVLAARLRTIQVEDYEQSAMYKMVQDSGINISGLPTADGIGTAFIGLGPEPAAQKFRDTLRQAIEAAG